MNYSLMTLSSPRSTWALPPHARSSSAVRPHQSSGRPPASPRPPRAALPPLLRLLSPRPLEGPSAPCYHGGSSWTASGFDFAKRDALVVADVLDAPSRRRPRSAPRSPRRSVASPRESPPTHAEPLVAAIAAARGVPPTSSSSPLDHRRCSSRCCRDCSPRARACSSSIRATSTSTSSRTSSAARSSTSQSTRATSPSTSPPSERAVRGGRYDMICLVNPNSPTGQHAALDGRRRRQGRICAAGKPIVWVDETYIDYVSDAGGGRRSSPRSAAGSPSSCKSLSKVVPLAGLRVACAPNAYARPPGDVGRSVATSRRGPSRSRRSSPRRSRSAIVAEYGRARRDEVRAEREVMRARLIDVLEAPYGVKVLSGCANFFLLELPKDHERRRRAAPRRRLPRPERRVPAAVWRGVGAHRGALPCAPRAARARRRGDRRRRRTRARGEAVAETPAPRARFDPWSR